MIIERETIEGWATCSRDRISEGDCQGYNSVQIPLIAETSVTTFGDQGAPVGDPNYDRTSLTHERLLPLHEEHRHCQFCGSLANLSREPRTRYRRLWPTGPDQLVHQAARERQLDGRAEQALTADERANEIAQQQLLETKRGNDLREQELLERREFNLLTANGGEAEPVAPRPRKRAT